MMTLDEADIIMQISDMVGAQPRLLSKNRFVWDVGTGRIYLAPAAAPGDPLRLSLDTNDMHAMGITCRIVWTHDNEIELLVVAYMGAGILDMIADRRAAVHLLYGCEIVDNFLRAVTDET